jgi:putative transposase
MARLYSIDLRERTVAAVLKGGLSRHRAAAQFGVAPSTVINWVRRFRETGSVAPGQMAVTSQGQLLECITPFWCSGSRNESSPCAVLWPSSSERGLKVDYQSVWNFVHAETNVARILTRRQSKKTVA